MTAATYTPSVMERTGAVSGRPIVNESPWRLYSLALWLAPLKALLEGVETKLEQLDTADRDRAIGRYIESNGRTFTDSVEREISRRYGGV